MKVKSLQQLICLFSLLLATGMLTTGCDSMIFDEEGDCSVRYNVAFSYTQNMAFADAFASRVKSVTLYVVDKNGTIVTSRTESGEALAKPGYTMQVDVQPGIYDLLVWAQGESPVNNPVDFRIGGGSSPTQITQLSASLPLKDDQGTRYSNQDIKPLFHGLMRDVEFPDTYGDVNIGPIDLTKDTNTFQVLIQSIDGTYIDPEEFLFSIEDNNSELSYTNAVIPSFNFEYRPWSVTPTSASFDKPQTKATRADETINGLLAELSTGRLIAGSNPQLVIHRITDTTDVIRIDLLEYLLMVKGEYNRQMSNQQYLDRNDFYTLMFFLDSNRNWYTAGGMYINGWRIVPPVTGTL